MRFLIAACVGVLSLSSLGRTQNAPMSPETDPKEIPVPRAGSPAFAAAQ